MVSASSYSIESLERALAERKPWQIGLFLFLVGLVVYLNSFPGTFIQDDFHIVLNNPLLADFDLLKILTSEYWQGIENNGLYRPVTILSFALNRWCFGGDAWGYHLVNVLLHGMVAVLLWSALIRWGVPQLTSFLAAIFFAVHPLHTEVVNQIVGRSELLAALFLLAALIAARAESSRSLWLVCGAFLLALLSKEHAVVFPGVLFLCDLLVSRAFLPDRRRLPLYGALLAIILCWLLWRKIGVVHDLPPTVLPPVAVPLAYLSATGRILTALQLQGLYLAKLLVPLQLQASYASTDLPAPVTGLFSPGGVLTVLCAFIVLAGVGVALWRRYLLGVLAALYLLSFALTANLFFPIGVTFAERLTYLPSLWFCSALAVLATRLLHVTGWQRIVLPLVLVYSCGLAGLTLARNPDFSTGLRYWQADVKQNPDDFLALMNSVELLAEEGRFDEAEAGYRKIFALVPEFSYAYRSRTVFLLNQKRYSEALDSANKALSLARSVKDRTGEGYDLGDLGRIYLAMGDFTKALTYLEAGAQALGKPDADLDLRATALAGLGRNREAREILDRLGVTPEMQYQQGLVLFNNGRLAEARVQLENLTSDNSGNPEIWNLYGAICAQQGDWTSAVAAFERALALAPNNSHYRDNLFRARQSLAAPPAARQLPPVRSRQ